jgi:hypothetical protein
MLAVTEYPQTYSIDNIEEYVMGIGDLNVSILDRLVHQYRDYPYRVGLRYRAQEKDESPEELYLWMCSTDAINSANQSLTEEQVILTPGVKEDRKKFQSPQIPLASASQSVPPQQLGTAASSSSSSFLTDTAFGKPLPGLIVGDWNCPAVKKISETKRVYVASRCVDLSRGRVTAQTNRINPQWLKGLPTGFEWYVDDVGKPIPTVFLTDDQGRLLRISTPRDTTSGPPPDNNQFIPSPSMGVPATGNPYAFSGLGNYLSSLAPGNTTSFSSGYPVPSNMPPTIINYYGRRDDESKGNRNSNRGGGGGKSYYQSATPFPRLPF